MAEKTLSDYANEFGQEAAAKLLGRNQGSVSKAIRKKRDIRLVFKDDGSFSHHYEIKLSNNIAA